MPCSRKEGQQPNNSMLDQQISQAQPESENLSTFSNS